MPVLSPDTALAREVAGQALVPYQLDDSDSLASALCTVDDPIEADPFAFDAHTYFRWLFQLPSEQYGDTRGAIQDTELTVVAQPCEETASKAEFP